MILDLDLASEAVEVNNFEVAEEVCIKMLSSLNFKALKLSGHQQPQRSRRSLLCRL